LVCVRGWHAAESWGRWTDGPEAQVLLDADLTNTKKLALSIEIANAWPDCQVSAVVNGAPLEARLAPNRVVRWKLPYSATSRQRMINVVIKMSRAVRPAQEQLGADERLLGIAIRTIRIERLDGWWRSLTGYLKLRARYHSLVFQVRSRLTRHLQPAGHYPPSANG